MAVIDITFIDTPTMASFKLLLDEKCDNTPGEILDGWVNRLVTFLLLWYNTIIQFDLHLGLRFKRNKRPSWQRGMAARAVSWKKELDIEQSYSQRPLPETHFVQQGHIA